jgi:hypothetical protein
VGTKRIPSITTEELIEVEEIAFEKQTVENANQAQGTVTPLQKGKPGKLKSVYRLTLQDGVVIKKVLIRSEVLEEPQVEITEIGTLVEKPRQEPSAPADTIYPIVPSSKQEEERESKVASAQESQKTAVTPNNLLPETGEQSNWWLSLIGILMMFLTFIGLSDKKSDH